DDARAPFLVRRRADERVLEEMRERAVSDVVQEGGGQRLLGDLVADAVLREQVSVDVAQARDEALHHVGAADGVRETGVLGAGEGERGDAELPDAAKTLHLRGSEQADDDRVFRRIERDEPVDRVAKDHVGASTKEVGSEAEAVAHEARATATLPSTKCTRA